MKSRIATVLSLSGVLVAGSAAALVNTRVLSGGGGANASAVDESTVVGPGSTTSSVEGSMFEDITVPTATSVPDENVTDTTGDQIDDQGRSQPTGSKNQPGASSSSTSPTSTTAAYSIGTSGTVTLGTSGDRLTIVSTIPNAGWQVTKAAAGDGINVEVRFRSATVEVIFRAKMTFGVIGTSVEARELSPSTTDGTDGTPTTLVDDHDDDEPEDSTPEDSTPEDETEDTTPEYEDD